MALRLYEDERFFLTFKWSEQVTYALLRDTTLDTGRLADLMADRFRYEMKQALDRYRSQASREAPR